MFRTLKVTGNHVMYDRGSWFLRVIMSSSRALCCLPSVNFNNFGFSGNFPKNFPYRLSPFRNFRSFWLNEKCPIFPRFLYRITSDTQLISVGCAASISSFFFFFKFFIWSAFFLCPCISWSTCYGHWLWFAPWSGGACWLTLEYHRQSIFLLGWARFCTRLTSKSISQVDKSH